MDQSWLMIGLNMQEFPSHRSSPNRMNLTAEVQATRCSRGTSSCSIYDVSRVTFIPA
jgi:hypothetical protein